MEEEWKPVDEVPEYLVSNFGRVKGRRGALMSLITNACGYKTASLFVNKKTRYRQVHRLVALAFIPNPNNLPYVNHIDGDKLNNHVNNLEWVTAKENAEKTVHPAVENVRRSRKVVQLSLSKDYIKTWNSVRQAADELKLDPILITNACKNADCVQDWRWLFHEDYVEPYADELWETIEVDKVSYTVSSHGRIRLANGQIVVGGQKGKYYRYKSHAVHRLVALAFCANQRGEGCNTVAHKDGNALNNKASNLEWTTHRDSCKHAHTIGLCRRRPVRRFLPNGTVIEYETVKAASAASGVASSDIVGACRGKKHRPGGSRWEYIEVNTTDEKEAENLQKPEDPKGPAPGPEKNSTEPEMTEAELEALFWKLLGFDEQTDAK